jgi:sodium/hydrogen antiporter
VTLLASFLALVFVFSLISARVGRTILTPPILFTAAGAGVSLLTSELGVHEGNLDTFLTLAEIGLVLLLFSDASRTDLGLLRDIRALPARLLGPGMLLTLLLGTLAALAVFHQLTFWEAGILAAILAPTDAGLGQIIVNSPRVPRKIREALNVEAGLNDGPSVPFLLFFIALAGSGFSGSEATLHQFIWEQLGYGTLVGLGLGLAGGWLLGVAHRKHAVAAAWSQLGVVTLPLLCLIISEEIGASMFIAAFVGGLAVQVFFKQAGQHAIEFTEEWGQILNLSVFFLFGMVVVRALPELTAAHWVYAVLSLTLVRMLPVAIALLGTKVSRATVLFMGWFGPRGLASIVLALVYLEHHAGHPGESSIRLAAMATILLSILLHGLTARPGIDLYARAVTQLDPSAPEREEGKHPA